MICRCCGKKFERTHHNQKYCSDECRAKVKKMQDKQNHKKYCISAKENKPDIVATCEYCGEQFIKTHGNQKYCSKECADNKYLEQNNDAAMKYYHHKKKLRGGDKVWGLGTGGLGPHRYEDIDLELTKVQNEMARLGLPSK